MRALRHSTSYGDSPGHCDSVLCLCVLGGVGGFGVLSPGDCDHVMLSDKAWLPSISSAYQLAQVAAIALVYCDLYDMHVEMYVFLYLLQSS